MFKFNFDLEHITDDAELILQENVPQVNNTTPTTEKTVVEEQPCKEISIEELLEALPTDISCAPLTIPLNDGKSISLYRRDLFDARFQLIAEGSLSLEEEEEKSESESENRHASALKFIEAPSDLVPMVYEGGLKTWECSIDLVEYLDFHSGHEGFQGKHILELGCGTAIPSLYILHNLFSAPLPSDGIVLPETKIYLQDYNHSALELVTFPNIFLAWYLSPASSSYRTSQEDQDQVVNPPTTPEPLELSISPELKSAFFSSIKGVYNITLHFFSGSWSSFNSQLQTLHPDAFDMVLTSETIYRMDSLPSLVDTMRLACTSNSDEKQQCLVAAKVLYFGVGGGVSDFVDFIKKNSLGDVKTVWEKKTGVGRVIMAVEWRK